MSDVRESRFIWINGPFGGGKTQTAYELHWRLPGSVVCDPELLGIAIQRVLPDGRSTDFQDLPLWREFVLRALLESANREGGGPLIVPMTLVVPDYVQEIVGGLRAAGHTVNHFALLAPREVVLRRLRTRLDFQNSWAARQLDRCLEAFKDPLFAESIHTKGKSIEQIAEEIAIRSGFTLEPSPGGQLRRVARRLVLQARHIR